jgi:hypothetical protein
MGRVPDSFVHYNAAWNEPDAARVRGHLELAVADGVVFADPDNRTEGIDALEAMIREARRERPDAEYAVASGVDGGHDLRYRYHWEVRTGDGGPPVIGTDVTTVDASGRITRIDGFFDDLPRIATHPD